MSVILPAFGHKEVVLSEAQIQVLIEIEPLLRAAQLHLACPRCLAAGRGSEALVGGRNHMGDARWSVECPCTTRTYQRTLAS